MPGLHVSGVLINADPECLNSVQAQLESTPGVEIHTVTPEGRLVTVIEQSTDDELVNTFTNIQNTAGVLSASLVYHYSENENAAEQETAS
ncbi:MAG: chaperone NapD [Gammaproteobacteria bacterium]|jgi:nitrate reductase NapD|nr:hypothetical protein [Chromatiales bacterium]MDP6675125.1 chaperone NapD [Gammaproteobacteria bacterium]